MPLLFGRVWMGFEMEDAVDAVGFALRGRVGMGWDGMGAGRYTTGIYADMLMTFTCYYHGICRISPVGSVWNKKVHFCRRYPVVL